MKTNKEKQNEILKEIEEIKNSIKGNPAQKMILEATNFEIWLLKQKAKVYKKEVSKGCGKEFSFKRLKMDGTIANEFIDCQEGIQLCPSCQEVLNKYKRREYEEKNMSYL